MQEWIRRWWHETTTQPCSECGLDIPVNDYRRTGQSRKGTWWSGGGVEFQCPHCGASFWAKK